MVWLVSDFDHRDPDDELHDVETGRCLEALDYLPGNLRLLIQDNHCRVHIKEVDNSYRAVKIIKKREAEFLQGSENYFIYDKFGIRINLSEEEYDKLLGLEHNPEDVFNAEDVELETLDSDQNAPMDVWDVVWDASDYVNTAQRMIESGASEYELGLLREGQHPQHEDVKEYSADFFPYPSYRSTYSHRAVEVEAKILSDNLNRAGMMKMLYPAQHEDQRAAKAAKLKAKARTLPLGKERARLFKQAEAMLNSWRKAQKTKKKIASSELSRSECRRLWETWRKRQIDLHGSVELTHWQWAKMYYAKLKRQGIQQREAEDLTCRKVKELYNQTIEPEGFVENISKLRSNTVLPEWIKEKGVPLETADYDYQPSDWLPSLTQLDVRENTNEETA